jgi:hypothetical protein
MSKYLQNFETLVEQEIKVNDLAIIKMKLDRNKTSKALKIHIREFVTTPEYTGFSAKNGFSIAIEDASQVAELNKTISSFLTRVENNILTNN